MARRGKVARARDAAGLLSHHATARSLGLTLEQLHRVHPDLLPCHPFLMPDGRRFSGYRPDEVKAYRGLVLLAQHREAVK